jgi:hypothetical protein
MLEFVFNLHIASQADSVLASTREFWRRKLGLPEEIVTDPRKLDEIKAFATKNKTGVQ